MTLFVTGVNTLDYTKTQNNKYRLIILFLLSVFLYAASSDASDLKGQKQSSPGIPVFTYKIVALYPHDPGAFTEGLAYNDGVLYESTGLYGKSELRKIGLKTGHILQSHKLPDEIFGEGIAIYKDKVIQLTWKSEEGFVYDRDSFKILRRFHYPTEGWGITHYGKRLIMSDGTDSLYFLDAATFKQLGQIEVRDSNGPVTMLNELEYIEGEIFANVWKGNRIARISPATGKVTGWIDLEGLSIIAGGDKIQKTLNGIAYDRKNKRLFVTGKLWPNIFEIELTPKK